MKMSHGRRKGWIILSSTLNLGIDSAGEFNLPRIAVDGKARPDRLDPRATPKY
jgi:hypothetical protein